MNAHIYMSAWCLQVLLLCRGPAVNRANRMQHSAYSTFVALVRSAIGHRWCLWPSRSSSSYCRT